MGRISRKVRRNGEKKERRVLDKDEERMGG